MGPWGVRVHFGVFSSNTILLLFWNLVKIDFCYFPELFKCWYPSHHYPTTSLAKYVLIDQYLWLTQLHTQLQPHTSPLYILYQHLGNNQAGHHVLGRVHTLQLHRLHVNPGQKCTHEHIYHIKCNCTHIQKVKRTWCRCTPWQLLESRRKTQPPEHCRYGLAEWKTQ